MCLGQCSNARHLQAIKTGRMMISEGHRVGSRFGCRSESVECRDTQVPSRGQRCPYRAWPGRRAETDCGQETPESPLRFDPAARMSVGHGRVLPTRTVCFVSHPNSTSFGMGIQFRSKHDNQLSEGISCPSEAYGRALEDHKRVQTCVCSRMDMGRHGFHPCVFRCHVRWRKRHFHEGELDDLEVHASYNCYDLNRSVGVRESSGSTSTSTHCCVTFCQTDSASEVVHVGVRQHSCVEHGWRDGADALAHQAQLDPAASILSR